MTTHSLPLAPARLARTARVHVTATQLAGLCCVVAGVIILMGIITAETLYPAAYTTAGNEISDLGGTKPPEGLVFQPSATIFDLTMLASGALVALGAAFVQRAFGRPSVSIPIALLGASAFGVGVFPGNTGTPHALVAMGAFGFGGLAGIAAARVIRGPFRLVSIALGATTLVALLSYLFQQEASPFMAFGIGGAERWIVYPVVLWVTSFGGYLAGLAEAPEPG